MRKLLLLALLLPLLCSAGGFGYSYEEKVLPHVVDICRDTVTYGFDRGKCGIFKVYLDVELEDWMFVDGYELIVIKYKGLAFTLTTDQNRIWVENVHELPPQNSRCQKTLYYFPPSHTEAWEIRCLAIEEIERLKKKDSCVVYCGRVKGWIYHGGIQERCWKYCPYCGEKLK